MSTDTEVPLKAPFPYFGGKSRVAPLIWSRFGEVRNYVEPFAGSMAVLLARPTPFSGVETVNDADGMVSNFWRAVQADPDAVAFHADWPVIENDLHARHVWLVSQKESLQERLDGDAEFYDPKIAGWWCWGLCCWIGSGFCSGKGPWHAVEDAAGVRKLVHLGNSGQGVNRQLVHLGDAGRGVDADGVNPEGIERCRPNLRNAGQGINKKMPHMNNHASPARGVAGAVEDGVERKRISLANAGRGVHKISLSDDGVSRKRPLVTNDSVGIAGRAEGVYAWMRALSDRFRLVRVCSGDWSRVCGPTVTIKQGLTAAFLDPPYADTAGRQADLYRVDCDQVAHDVRRWAIERGEDPQMRICLAGYDGEHQMPDSWEVVEWKAPGGFGSQGADDSQGKENCKKERLWFSPHCLKGKKKPQREMFAE